jgi:hypothetical protein
MGFDPQAPRAALSLDGHVQHVLALRSVQVPQIPPLHEDEDIEVVRILPEPAHCVLVARAYPSEKARQFRDDSIERNCARTRAGDTCIKPLQYIYIYSIVRDSMGDFVPDDFQMERGPARPQVSIRRPTAEMTVAELKEVLAAYGLVPTGLKKAELLALLDAYESPIVDKTDADKAAEYEASPEYAASQKVAKAAGEEAEKKYKEETGKMVDLSGIFRW